MLRTRGGFCAAALGLAAVLLAGCGSSSASTGRAPTRTSPTAASPVVVDAPSWPDAGNRPDVAGATAAVRYWFDALTYAYRVSDTKPLLAASTASCRACLAQSSAVTATFSYGGDVRGGGYTIRTISPTEFSAATPILTVVFDRRAMTVAVAGGATSQSIPAVSFGSARVLMEYDGGQVNRWRVADIDGLGKAALTTDVAPSPGWTNPG